MPEVELVRVQSVDDCVVHIVGSVTLPKVKYLKVRNDGVVIRSKFQVILPYLLTYFSFD